MASRLEVRLTPQGKKYLCLVMGEGQFPPNISLRNAEAVLCYLEDVKRLVAQKVELCSKYGIPLPQGQGEQVAWGSSSPQSGQPNNPPQNDKDIPF